MELILGRSIRLHLIIGIIFSVIIFCLFLLQKYDEHIRNEREKLVTVQMKSNEMILATVQTDELIKGIEPIVPSLYYERSHREFMLESLDEIKKVFKGAELIVNYINKDEDIGGLQVPIDLYFPLSNYGKLLKNLGDLQNRKFPYVTIKGLRIQSTESQGTTCSINALLRMPTLLNVDEGGEDDE